MTTRFDPREWPTSTDYLYGVDLFNYCYWWEAHEVFLGIEVALFERAVGAYFTGVRGIPPVIELVPINGDGTFRNSQRAKNKRNSGA